MKIRFYNFSIACYFTKKETAQSSSNLCRHSSALTGNKFHFSINVYTTEEGMIPFEQAEEKLTCRYRRVEAVERINLIKKLKADGRSIPQIKEFLESV